MFDDINKTVLVTGIGGNVGQGILRNIRQYNSEIRIIGTNVTALSAGTHLCNMTYVAPYAYDKDYIPIMSEICNKEGVDLIIPSTDYESMYLSNSSTALPMLATSDYETNRLFTDKWLTFLHFSEYNIPFAHSIKPSEYNGEWVDFIVKPREGRGSRGIHINPQHISSFGDEYVVQEKLNGVELTSAFYVTKQGRMHGQITFERSLENGATNICMVTTKYDSEIEKIGKKICAATPVRGAFNMQCIATSKGIIPFEINGRISGTNSIRGNFGFKDVEYILDEYLFGREPQPPEIKKGAAVRVLMDVIYSDVTDLAEIKNMTNKHYIF